MSKIFRIILVLFWIYFIFTSLTMQIPAYPENDVPGSDKFVHIFLFGILSFLIIYTLKTLSGQYSGTSGPRHGKKIALIFLFSFLFSCIYAVFMEYLQSFIPTRSASTYDFLAGLAGILMAQTIAYGIFVRKKT